MNTQAPRVRRLTLAASAVALASAAIVGAAPAEAVQHAPAAGSATTAAAQIQEIASSTLGHDLKVTLTAVRSTSDDLAASVQLTTYTFVDGAWQAQDLTPVGEPDSWFWFPLTGSQAVCQFSTASSGQQPIAVSLLTTPSIGCSSGRHYHLSDGLIVED